MCCITGTCIYRHTRSIYFLLTSSYGSGILFSEDVLVFRSFKMADPAIYFRVFLRPGLYKYANFGKVLSSILFMYYTQFTSGPKSLFHLTFIKCVSPAFSGGTR
jgi:hypothetical protein